MFNSSSPIGQMGQTIIKLLAKIHHKNIYSICNEFDQRNELLLKHSTWAEKYYWFNNGLSFYVIIVYPFLHIIG